MYNKTYEYYVNPTKRLFCSDDEGTPISDLPRFYFGERPVFTLTFEDGVLVEGEKFVFVMDNENRFLDSHSTTGLAPVMAWCVHEITAEDAQNKSIDLELYCFGKKYADVINGHDNAVTCILSLFIKSIDENLNCTFSTLATTLAYAEPTIVSPDCVFDELPIDMYLTRDEMNALIAEVEAIQREAIAKAEQARQSAAVAEAAAQEASQIAKDLKPLQLSSPPTTSTVGSVGQLAVWHDATTNKDHLYHLCFISTSESATLYHWEECVLLDSNGLVPVGNLPYATLNGRAGIVIITSYFGFGFNGNILRLSDVSSTEIDNRVNFRYLAPNKLDYAVRSVLPKVTEIPAATSDYSLVDSSATTNNHSHVYSHSPSAVPSYRLPQVTNTTISHYIELTVDFTNVQTYSFLDYQGEPIVPLFTPSIAAGDVYTFKMEYSAIKAAWLIYPQKQGAVADDFVMRGEVGAANGVAGLDANGKVAAAQLTKANNSTFGIVAPNRNQGTIIDNNGYLAIIRATAEEIDNKTQLYKPIVPSNLNYAVTAALTDSNKISLNDEQKAAAQEVFGVGGDLVGTGAPTTSTVGKVMDRYLDTATGKTYTCTAVNVDDTDPNNVVTTYTWEECALIQNNGKIANELLPNAATNGLTDITAGVVHNPYSNVTTLRQHLGVGIMNGVLYIWSSTNEEIDQRRYSCFIKPSNLEYAVRSVLDNVTVIPSATTAYTLADASATTNNHSKTYLHSPSAASIYTLPSVSDDGLLHEIILTIKFSSTVLTYEFQDSAGTTLVPLPLNGDIEAGSVVTFLCRYNPLLSQWVIYPVMDGKEVQA